MSDYFVERMKEFIHMQGQLCEMRGYVRSAMQRRPEGPIDRWVIEEVFSMINVALAGMPKKDIDCGWVLNELEKKP